MMRSLSNHSEPIPPVRLVSDGVPEVRVKIELQEPGNFRDHRIDQFLSLKDFSENSKRNYRRQLKAFIAFVDRDCRRSA